MKDLFCFFLCVFSYSFSFSCTAIVVTKGATVDGSVIVAQSDDDHMADQRIVFVPAKEHKNGEKRAINPVAHDYPRDVGKERASVYEHKNFPPSKISGYIDQVKHTYSYFDGTYGIINEHQLAIGEATNVSYYHYNPDKNMIFDISELSRIALERCKKARDAIKTVGELAEEYGYFDDAETLIFADTDEAWVFEISATPYKKGAMWVAKKVPDGEVFVCANQLRIREIKPNDPDTMYSKNLFKIAKEMNWIQTSGEIKFDWLKSICPGELHHPYYSLRRVWRLQSKINPDLKLSPWVDDAYTKEYPFSIKPAKKLSVHDVMELYRDHYEGTEFDLTKGIAAGPFGCPSRYIGPYEPDQNIGTPPKKTQGAWERSISIFYTGFVHINQLRGWLPDAIGGVSWIGYDEPYTTCFIPFYVGVNNLPDSFQNGSTRHFDKQIAFWTFNFVTNWAQLKYSYMIQDIQKIQKEIELSEITEQESIEKKALSFFQTDEYKAKEFLTSYCNENTSKVLEKWQNLAYFLIEKYTEGYINKPKLHEEVGYPAWWRQEVGYPNGPTSYTKKQAPLN